MNCSACDLLNASGSNDWNTQVAMVQNSGCTPPGAHEALRLVAEQQECRKTLMGDAFISQSRSRSICVLHPLSIGGPSCNAVVTMATQQGRVHRTGEVSMI